MSGFDLPPIGWEGGGRPNRGELPRLADTLARPDVTLPDIELRPGEGEPETAQEFAGVLADSLDQVRGLQNDVREQVRGLVLGEDVELHDVLIAGGKSEVAFNLLLEVRNKLVNAWEQLSRSTV